MAVRRANSKSMQRSVSEQMGERIQESLASSGKSLNSADWGDSNYLNEAAKTSEQLSWPPVYPLELVEGKPNSNIKNEETSSTPSLTDEVRKLRTE